MRECPEDLRILVVDDEVPVATALARILRYDGHDVVVAHSCSEVLSLPGSHLVGVFDINLGDGYGTNIAKLLVQEGRVLHCVFMTGFADSRRIADAASLGPVFQKADGVQPLVEHVDKLVSKMEVFPRSRRVPRERGSAGKETKVPKARTL